MFIICNGNKNLEISLWSNVSRIIMWWCLIKGGLPEEGEVLMSAESIKWDGKFDVWNFNVKY